MSRKTSPARRAAFLQTLAETGNQTIAAERAKVSRSWVQLHRSTDPAFDADVRAAIAGAKAALRADPSPQPLSRKGRGTNQPPSRWGHLDGEELVVRGTGGSEGRKRVQIARARLKQWTGRIEDRFLAVLAATCNVKAACAEVGMTAASAYAHRKRWPAFARRWDEALSEGCLALETALLDASANLFASPALPPAEAGAAPAPAIAPMDAHQALHLLYMHKHYQPRPGRLPGRAPTRATEAETIKAIERQFALLERREKRKAKGEEATKGRHGTIVP
jgi:hypothetical protein